jgi:hypothetical protein
LDRAIAMHKNSHARMQWRLPPARPGRAGALDSRSQRIDRPVAQMPWRSSQSAKTSSLVSTALGSS